MPVQVIDKMDVLHTAEVDTEMSIQLLDIVTKKPIHRMCWETLSRHLFTHGLIVEAAKTPNSKKHKLEDDTDEASQRKDNMLNPSYVKLINNKWSPYTQETILHIIAMGFFVLVPITESSREFGNNKIRYPTVLHPAFYKVKIITNKDLTVQYNVHLRQDYGGPTRMSSTFEDNPDSRVMLYVCNGSAPDKFTGRHNSIVASTLNLTLADAQLKQADLLAVIQNTRPVTTIQKDADQAHAANSEKKPTQFEQYSDVIILPSQIQSNNPSENQYAVNGSASSIVEEIEENRRKSTMVRNPDQLIPNAPDRTILGPSDLITLREIPKGYKLTAPQPPMSLPISNLIEREELMRQDIAGTYRIPLGMLYPAQAKGGKATLSSGSAIENEENKLFAKTLEVYKKLILHEICPATYMFMYPKMQEMDVAFDLPLPPIISLQQIYHLEEQDVISTELRNNLLAQVSCIPGHYLLPPGQMNKHNRPPVGANPDYCQDFMDARTSKVWAEAKKTMAEAAMIKKESSAENSGLELEEFKAESSKEMISIELEAKREMTEMELQAQREKIELNREEMELKKEMMEFTTKQKQIQAKAAALSAKKRKTASS